MKISEEVNKSYKKNRLDKNFHNIMKILIGYPLFYPFYKTRDFIESSETKYWKNNLEKLYKKSFSEMIKQINKELVRTKTIYQSDTYKVYNSRMVDDIHFCNAFYLHAFIGSGYYNQKSKKYSYKYYTLVQQKKVKVDYNKIFEELKQYFSDNYTDIEITEGQEPIYKGGQQYFEINFLN